MSQHRYRVVAKRFGGWWAISVPELRGVHSQARRLDQVEDMARDAIALMLDVDPEDVSVAVEPVLPKEVSAAVARVVAARDASRQAEQAERDALRRAAQVLAEQGLSRRETGHLLGLSHQRVQQLVSAGGGTAQTA